MVPVGARLALAGLALAGCVVSFQEQAPYDEALPLDGQTRVEIRGLTGGIELRAAGDEAFVARGTAWASGATRADALSNLDEARLTGRVLDGSLLAVFDPPLELAGLVDLELDRVSDVPPDVAVTAHMEGGGIAARGLQGDLDLATPDGDVAVEGAGPGSVLVRAGRGEVSVEAGGGIDAEAGRGLEIRSRGQGGEAIRGATRGGRILLRLEQPDFRIICRTDGGEVVVGPEFDASVSHEADGSVVVTAGDQGAARDVLLVTAGGWVGIERLAI